MYNILIKIYSKVHLCILLSFLVLPKILIAFEIILPVNYKSILAEAALSKDYFFYTDYPNSRVIQISLKSSKEDVVLSNVKAWDVKCSNNSLTVLCAGNNRLFVIKKKIGDSLNDTIFLPFNNRWSLPPKLIDENTAYLKKNDTLYIYNFKNHKYINKIEIKKMSLDLTTISKLNDSTYWTILSDSNHDCIWYILTFTCNKILQKVTVTSPWKPFCSTRGSSFILSDSIAYVSSASDDSTKIYWFSYFDYKILKLLKTYPGYASLRNNYINSLVIREKENFRIINLSELK